MKRNVVIFDIDGVLADFEGALVDFVSRNFGEKVASLNRDVYSIEKRYKNFPEVMRAALEFVHDPNSYYPVKAYPGMVDLLFGLEDAGFIVAYVTVRGMSCREVTYRWLKKNGFPVSEDRVVLGVLNKADVLNKDYVAFAVDDNPKQVLGMKKAGIPALCMERDWNEDVFPRLYLSKLRGEPSPLPTVWEEITEEPIRLFQWIEKLEL